MEFKQHNDTQDTILSAWRMATRNRTVEAGLIFHSDRGVQYANNKFANVLDSYKKITLSMSRKGNCWDNAVAGNLEKSNEFLEDYYKIVCVNDDL